MSTRSIAILLLIFSLGAILRFHALERQSLWDDEMATLHGISLPLRGELEFQKTREPHPPLFFLQLRVWKNLFGDSLGTLRANSAVWGTLSIFLIFALGRFYASEPVGLAAAAFLALSPLHLAYSQELRPYALSIFLAMAVFLALGRLLREGKGAVLLGSLWTCQLFAHYWGAFVCAAAGLYGLFAAPTREVRRKVIAAGIVSVGCFTLWLPVLRAELRGIDAMSFWMPAASPMNLVKTFAAFTGLYFKVASRVFQAPGPLFLHVLLAVTMGVLLIVGIWCGPRAWSTWLIVGLLLPELMSYWKWGIFLWYRYTTHMYPAFVLLVFSGVFALPRRRARAPILAALLASQLLGISYYVTDWQKANPKEVVRYVESIADSNTIVIRPSYFGPLFNYYDQGRLKTVDEHQLDSDEKRLGLRGRRVVFVSLESGSDVVGDALRSQLHLVPKRSFSGFAHLGITVWATD